MTETKLFALAIVCAYFAWRAWLTYKSDHKD